MSDAVRTLLWTLVVVSVVANTVASYAGAGTAVHLAVGATTVVCVAALAVRGLQGRR